MKFFSKLFSFHIKVEKWMTRMDVDFVLVVLFLMVFLVTRIYFLVSNDGINFQGFCERSASFGHLLFIPPRTDVPETINKYVAQFIPSSWS